LSKRTNLPAAIAIFAIALAALIVAGCGGGSDSSSSGGDSSSSSTSSSGGGGETAPPSKAGFVTQGDAVCKNGSEEVQAGYATYLKENKIKKIGEGNESEAESEARIEEVIEAAIPILRQQLDSLKALDVPAGDEAQFNAYVKAAEEGIEKGEEDPVELFTATGKVFAKSDKLAKEIGFKVCGNR
jgi:hypothetical protein